MSTPLPPGYELVRVLGSGAFGEVVLARQISLGRLVAVKRIHAYALTGAEDIARFRREAQVLAALDHPAIVRVHDFVQDGPRAALVMEHVAGRSLADMLGEGPIPPPQALRALHDVADALRAACARGVAHRDVKPGNVLVLPDGQAKLADFGLARIVSDPTVFRTHDGSASGTPAYFAPESGVAEPNDRSDAYSFGVMAYEVLVGRLPFDAPDIGSLLAAHLVQPPPPPETLVPGFPPAASAALLAALAKEPGQRLLPWQLVEQLTAVPTSAWPGASARLDARPGAAGRAAETVSATPQTHELPLPALPGRRRRRVAPAVVGAAAAAVAAVAGIGLAAGLLGGGQAGGGPTEALVVEAAEVATVPADGNGSCPVARFSFEATLRTNGGPGDVVFGWTQPDGRETAVTTVQAAQGQRRLTAVLSFDVSGDVALTGAAVLRVQSPQALEATSLPISYTC